MSKIGKLFSGLAKYWNELMQDQAVEAPFPGYEPYFPGVVQLPAHEYTVAEGEPVLGYVAADRLHFYNATLIMREPVESTEAGHPPEYNFYIRLRRSPLPFPYDDPAREARHYMRVKAGVSGSRTGDYIDQWNTNHANAAADLLERFISMMPRESWKRDGVPLASPSGYAKNNRL